MRRLRQTGGGRRLFVSLAVGAAAFGVASAVQASIPGPNHVIHGCYKASSARAAVSIEIPRRSRASSSRMG